MKQAKIRVDAKSNQWELQEYTDTDTDALDARFLRIFKSKKASDDRDAWVTQRWRYEDPLAADV